MKKLNYVLKLIMSSNKEDLQLAMNIINQSDPFTAYYCYKHLNQKNIPRNMLNNVTHPWKRLTTVELHKLATTEEQLQIVKDLYLQSFLSIHEVNSEQVKINLELKLYEQSSQFDIKEREVSA
jgi:hypothetical protein